VILWIFMVIGAMAVLVTICFLGLMAYAYWEDRREDARMADVEDRADGLCAKVYELHPQTWAGQPLPRRNGHVS
jgi:hypothetical protein